MSSVPCALRYYLSHRPCTSGLDQLSFEECRGAFFIWATLWRCPAAEQWQSEQSTCPLLFCREKFLDADCCQEHLRSCRFLADALYLCPHCLGPEQFFKTRVDYKTSVSPKSKRKNTRLGRAVTFVKRLARAPPTHRQTSKAMWSLPGPPRAMSCDDDPEPHQPNYPDFRHRPDTPDFSSRNSPVAAMSWLELDSEDIMEMPEEGYVAELPGLTRPAKEADICELDSLPQVIPRNPPHEPAIDPRLLDSPHMVDTMASMAELQINARAAVQPRLTLPQINTTSEPSRPFTVSPPISPVTSQPRTEEMIDVNDISPTQGTILGQGLHKHMPSVGETHSDGWPPFHPITSATRQKLQVFGSSVEAVNKTAMHSFAIQASGDDHLACLPNTTYAQALETMAMVYKGSTSFSCDQVMALVNLGLAITTHFDKMRHVDLVYEDVVSWSHVLVSESEQARFASIIKSTWQPASQSIDYNTSKLLIGSPLEHNNAGLLMTKLKGGFLMRICVRHLDVLQYDIVREDILSRFAGLTTYEPLDLSLREAFQEYIVTPLSILPELELFLPTMRKAYGLLQKGLLVSLREVEVMLVGEVQSQSYTDHTSQLYLSTVFNLCSQIWPDGSSTWREPSLTLIIEKMRIILQETDNEERRGLHRMLLGIPDESDEYQRRGDEPKQPSSSTISMTNPSNRVRKGSRTSSRSSDYGVTICPVPGCSRRYTGSWRDRQSNLQRHTRTKHTPAADRRVYACTVCRKQYTRSDGLSAHITKGKCLPGVSSKGPRRITRVMTA